jgi:Putative rRNA methylase
LRYFPLFQSHLDLAHSYWEDLLQKGDWAIDATCGAGNDTVQLAKLLHHRGGGGVVAMDIQEEAIARTQRLVEQSLPLEARLLVHLYHQSHSDFPQVVAEKSVKLIVYNLGYLPGSDKKLTTMTQTTLESVKKAMGLLHLGGALSITCYPGHAEGALEEKALLSMTETLSSAIWNVCYHSFPNRLRAPTLLLIQKNR